MKKLILILLVSLFYTYLPAQESSISQGAETITNGELRDHIFYLASDELEGRFPGTPGFEKAMEYAVIQLRQMILKKLIMCSYKKIVNWFMRLF